MKFMKVAISVLLILILKTHHLYAQEADSIRKDVVDLEEVIISVNKSEESKKFVTQQIQVINARQIESLQSQTTADLIANSGNVFVQKSQMGGGSPVIRGFEASRIVLVVDGVRMNNIIYRSGHLQNIVTMDNSILERAEILFGPSSTIYGSDALGGVIHMFTKKPLFSGHEEKTKFKVNAFTRYGSANNEMTGHLDVNVGGEKLASLTSLTYSSFDDLKGGKNQNPFYVRSYGERPYYVERINGVDSLVKNKDRYLQVQSGYSQYDLLQKLSFKQNEHLSHGLNIQFSNSSDVPRYDRLTDPDANGLRFAEWYYGPQKRLLAGYEFKFLNHKALFQTVQAGINFQDIEESRHTRRFGRNALSHRTENVNVYGVDLDFQRITEKHKLRFGLEGQYNTLKSTANEENILSGVTSALDTRYPDGDNSMSDLAIYYSHTWKINNELTVTDGIRIGMVSLSSTFVDTSFFHLPYTKAEQSNVVYSGSLGLIHLPSDDLKLSLMVSSGFRAPNVDDLSKVFESSPGLVIVPNADLKPEKTVNTEFGITKIFNRKTSWENVVYYTHFIDAVVTDKFKLNGQDSIFYDGAMSQVLANQNAGEAYIYGLSSNLKSQCTDNLSLNFSLNYTYGRVKTDSSDYPLDHIPPFMMRLQLSYVYEKFNADFFVNYNGWKKLKDYYLNGEDNEQYATAEGMPAWFTLNFRASYKLHKFVTLQAGVDNIFDTQYRTFASGINAPGRNVIAALRFHY
ncbi:MAG: TonB-dependent receptor [Bacteroidetes bacterium]|nr:MAG: TonB-dependent receptor [Bacteroidota bacterium]